MAGGAVFAESLAERVQNGEAVRLGFATEVPYAYPGDGNAPLGFVNAITIGVLNKMGIDDIQPEVTDWGGLIPGLQADRFDVITGGMDIIGVRCQNVSFSEPVAKVGPALLVPKGNPKQLATFEDLKSSGAKIVTVAGYSFLENFKRIGIPDSQVIQVPGTSELLATVKAGRADAGVDTSITLDHLAEQSDGKLEVTDPGLMPDTVKNWTGVAFRKSDSDFLAKFNAALADYIGSDEMMQAVKQYDYGTSMLPGDAKTEWVCANR